MTDSSSACSPRKNNDDPSAGPSAGRLNVFYRLTVIPVAALIITVLGLVAGLMGDPAAPVSRLLLRYWGPLVMSEVVLSLLFGLLALAVDRRRQAEKNVPASSSKDAEGHALSSLATDTEGNVAERHSLEKETPV